jgi:hypothetical protein
VALKPIIIHTRAFGDNKRKCSKYLLFIIIDTEINADTIIKKGVAAPEHWSETPGDKSISFSQDSRLFDCDIAAVLKNPRWELQRFFFFPRDSPM